jgi:hypothetical protein
VTGKNRMQAMFAKAPAAKAKAKAAAPAPAARKRLITHQVAGDAEAALALQEDGSDSDGADDVLPSPFPTRVHGAHRGRVDLWVHTGGGKAPAFKRTSP